MVTQVDSDSKEMSAKTNRPKENNTTSLAFSSDGDRLAVTNSYTDVYNVTRDDKPIVSSKSDRKLMGHSTDGVKNVVWHPDSATTLATIGADKNVLFFDLRGNRKRSNTTLSFENDVTVSGWCGELFIVVDSEQYLYKIDPKTVSAGATYKAKENGFKFDIGGIKSFTSTEHRLYLSCDNGSFTVLDIPALEKKYTIKAHPSSCNSINLDPTMDFFAIAAEDGTVSVWHEESLANRFVIDDLNNSIHLAKYSAVSTNLLAIADDKIIKFMDAHTGNCRHQLSSNHHANALDWHPSKPLLAYSCDKDTTPFNIWSYPPTNNKASR